MNARFWVWVNGGSAKVTMRPGQRRLRWSKCEDTDEGYSFLSEEWVYEHGAVYRSAVSGGRDCDGRIEYIKEFVCDVDKLRSHQLEELYPDRQTVSSEVYDQYARLMGY